MVRHSRRGILAGVAALGLAGCTGTDASGDRVSKSSERTLTAPKQLAVTNEVGDVTVTGEDRSDITLRVTRSGPASELDRLELTTDRTDGTLTVIGEISDDKSIRNDFGLSLTVELRVPQTVAVRSVETVAGDVRLTDTKGAPTVSATAGDVMIDGVDGTVSASTTTGDVTIREVTVVSNVEATAGQLSVDIASVQEETEVVTTTGDIGLALASSLDATVEVTAETGDVSVSRLPLSVTETTTGAVADGTMGEGNKKLTVETNVGDVALSRLES
ncbi:MAG: DUF4097 family beta strand repeat-containing protein [Halobaculum sp.]